MVSLSQRCPCTSWPAGTRVERRSRRRSLAPAVRNTAPRNGGRGLVRPPPHTARRRTGGRPATPTMRHPVLATSESMPRAPPIVLPPSSAAPASRWSQQRTPCDIHRHAAPVPAQSDNVDQSGEAPDSNRPISPTAVPRLGESLRPESGTRPRRARISVRGGHARPHAPVAPAARWPSVPAANQHCCRANAGPCTPPRSRPTITIVAVALSIATASSKLRVSTTVCASIRSMSAARAICSTSAAASASGSNSGIS